MGDFIDRLILSEDIKILANYLFRMKKQIVATM